MVCVLLAYTSKTQAQVQPWLFQFTTTPTLISGTNNQINSVYRFANVKTGVDALVTIVSSTGGATVNLLDDNNITKPEAFSPNIKVPNSFSPGFVEFNLSFVVAGTLTPIYMDSLYATAIDIDGGPDIHEIASIDLGGGISNYLSNNPEIEISQNGTTYTGTNLLGNEYPGIDTSAKQVMFTVKHNHVQNFKYIAGGDNTTGGNLNRQFSLYFKDFIYSHGSGPLYVQYLSFNAVVNDNAVQLNWVTSQELNHNYFQVERSFENKNFITIATVLDGISQNGTNKNYELKDKSADLTKNTVVYYRLKQIDLDGKVTYSKIISVRLQIKSNVMMQVSPNPFVSNVTFRFTAVENSTAQIQLFTSTGQMVLSKQSVVGRGYNNVQIDGLEKLASGMYIVKLMMNGKVIDTKSLIKN